MINEQSSGYNIKLFPLTTDWRTICLHLLRDDTIALLWRKGELPMGLQIHAPHDFPCSRFAEKYL